MRVVIVNPVWDRAHRTPTETLARFHTLTGWAEAVRAQPAVTVTVCQRYGTNASLELNGVSYRFCADRSRPVPRRSTRATRLFHQAVLDADPDVVHVNGLVFPELIRGLRAVLPQRTALVVQDHGGFEPSDASAFMRIWLRRGLAAADAVLVSSPGQAEELRQSRIAPAETLVADVMESSTTLRPIPRSQARAELQMMGEPSLLWVGRLNENKDPLTVLRGVAAWFPQHPRATLTMAFQEGALDEAVRRFVAATPELKARVSLVGAVPHDRLPAYYSAADLFVLGSHHEGSGYAAIEALACGAVPVVTDIAPFRALTDDGAFGALWQPGNAESFTLALDRARSRPLSEQRQAARERFDREFSWPHIGHRAMAIYREVIALRGPVLSGVRTHRPA
ncbi:MAG: glycosyltransferase family 4 protein [Acidobacteriota bacterium]